MVSTSKLLSFSSILYKVVAGDWPRPLLCSSFFPALPSTYLLFHLTSNFLFSCLPSKDHSKCSHWCCGSKLEIARNNQITACLQSYRFIKEIKMNHSIFSFTHCIAIMFLISAVAKRGYHSLGYFCTAFCTTFFLIKRLVKMLLELTALANGRTNGWFTIDL